MLSSRSRLVFLGAWCLASTLALTAARGEDAAALRTWSVVTAGGAQDLKASLKAISRGNAVFVDEAGQERTIALSDLSEADRKDALIQRVGSAVVVVHSKDVFDQPIGVGSGFVITGQGIILTNFHVIRG